MPSYDVTTDNSMCSLTATEGNSGTWSWQLRDGNGVQINNGSWPSLPFQTGFSVGPTSNPTQYQFGGATSYGGSLTYGPNSTGWTASQPTQNTYAVSTANGVCSLTVTASGVNLWNWRLFDQTGNQIGSGTWNSLPFESGFSVGPSSNPTEYQFAAATSLGGTVTYPSMAAAQTGWTANKHGVLKRAAGEL